MVEYEILDEADTRYHTKVNEEAGLIQIWVEYEIDGVKRRTRYSMTLDKYDDGRWRRLIEDDLKGKEELINKTKNKTKDSIINELKAFKGQKVKI